MGPRKTKIKVLFGANTAVVVVHGPVWVRMDFLKKTISDLICSSFFPKIILDLEEAVVSNDDFSSLFRFKKFIKKKADLVIFLPPLNT